MRAVERYTGRSCWSDTYLLSHCEGYRLDATDGTVGYVERVVRRPDGGPVVLRVNGINGSVTVAVADVVELHPHDESLLIRQTRRSLA